MRPDLPSELPLICPACKTRTDDEIELHTVELERVISAAADGDVETGILRCANCARRYPVVGGVPVLVADLGSRAHVDALAFAEEELPPDVLAILAEAGPDDTAVARGLEHLSIYLDSHWGDRATPPPDGPGAHTSEKLHARVAAAKPVARTVELGCSVGRGVHMARGELVVGLDVSLPSLRRARRLCRGESVTYARRTVGRHYTSATIQATPRAASFVCGDAMDPPLAPGSFDRVVVLNLLDAVAHPARILSVADALLVPGGELHVASPFNWQTGIVAEDGRLGGDDPVGWLRKTFTTGETLERPYRVVDEADVAWTLRRDARSAVSYATRYFVLQKT